MAYLKVYTDGASRNNPGESGIGIVIYDENGKILKEYKEYTKVLTNNQAEYTAIIRSISLIKKLSEIYKIESLTFYSDSDLMVNQLNFNYKIKEPGLALLNYKFHYTIKKLGIPFIVNYIPREKNKEADRLANEAIDKKVSSVESQIDLEFF